MNKEFNIEMYDLLHSGIPCVIDHTKNAFDIRDIHCHGSRERTMLTH